MSLADAGEQDAQIIVYLGDRADGRARVLAGGLLLDADGRRKAGEIVNIRLLQLAEELAGIGGQGLDIAPLPLGIERIEGEGALPGAADAGENDQPVAGKLEMD